MKTHFSIGHPISWEHSLDPAVDRFNIQKEDLINQFIMEFAQSVVKNGVHSSNHSTHFEELIEVMASHIDDHSYEYLNDEDNYVIE